VPPFTGTDGRLREGYGEFLTVGTTIRIARLHHPYCSNWKAGNLRFL